MDLCTLFILEMKNLAAVHGKTQPAKMCFTSVESAVHCGLLLYPQCAQVIVIRITSAIWCTTSTVFFYFNFRAENFRCICSFTASFTYAFFFFVLFSEQPLCLRDFIHPRQPSILHSGNHVQITLLSCEKWCLVSTHTHENNGIDFLPGTCVH